MVPIRLFLPRDYFHEADWCIGPTETEAGTVKSAHSNWADKAGVIVIKLFSSMKLWQIS
jgi:hypothetical protein